MLRIKKDDTAYLELKFPFSKLLQNPSSAPGGVAWMVVLQERILNELKKLNRNMETKNNEHNRIKESTPKAE